MRSLKAALEIAKKGHTISLSDGTYSEANGEVWPRGVPDAVTIEGTGRTVLSGIGNDCLHFRGGGEIRGIAFESCPFAVRAYAGSFRATSVKVNGGGMWFVENVDAVLNDVTIENVQGTALGVEDEARLSLSNATLRGTVASDTATGSCANGMEVRKKARATLTNVTFTDFGYTGIVVANDSSATLTNVTVSQTAPSAACKDPTIQVFVLDRASMIIEDSTISGTADPNVHDHGIWVNGESAMVQMRRSTLKNVYDCVEASGRFEAEDSAFEGCIKQGIAFVAKTVTSKLNRVTISMTSTNSYAVLGAVGSSAAISESTISTRSGGIRALEESRLSLRKSTVESREAHAIEAHSSMANLGTATAPGLNRILGDSSIFVGDSVRLDAAGNTWHPNVQGTNADGSHAPGLVRYEDVSGGKNFFLSGNASIQF
ncbi:right-handed parallel beta-helix repeat-containing protein [Pendulispora rubella]|uniref:Right-handed parallel beta-helix repeat-containing protein n=1 Tax=Pendulispora rubella TaxID=2741070 RepID=A0ABZ2KSZ1_9BACT